MYQVGDEVDVDVSGTGAGHGTHKGKVLETDYHPEDEDLDPEFRVKIPGLGFGYEGWFTYEWLSKDGVSWEPPVRMIV